MTKTISRFEPLPDRPLEECERHYVEVHVPFAQRALCDMEGLQTYHTNRALRQADISGGWRQRPRAWRFVVLRFDPGHRLSFSPEVSETIAQDHTNCLRRLQPFTVDERLIIDRRVDSLSLAKYLVEIDRGENVDADEAARAVDELVDRLAEMMGSAPGARLAFANRVTAEAETVPVTHEGQRGTGRRLDETTKCAFLELYFDHERYGDPVVAELGSGVDRRLFPVANLLHVEERCGVDRRTGPATH